MSIQTYFRMKHILATSINSKNVVSGNTDLRNTYLINYSKLKVIAQVSFERSVNLHRNFSLYTTKSMLSKTKQNKGNKAIDPKINKNKKLYEVHGKCHLGNSFKILKQKL